MPALTGVATAGGVVALPEALLEVYSLDILHAALPVMRFDEFAVHKTELTKQPGEKINFTKYDNIARGGKLNEHETIPKRTLSASQTSITVTEYGNAIGITEKLLQLSFDDMMAEAALQLGRDYALTMDIDLRNVVLSASTHQLYAGGADSRAALRPMTHPDPSFFDIELVRDAVELLQTGNVPKFNNDFYICFIHPHQGSRLRRDPEWIATNQLDPEYQRRGVIGRWEDVLFIATTNMTNGAAPSADSGYDAALVAAATADGAEPGGHVYKAAFCGDNAYGHAHALPVEMRTDGVTDFGRIHGLAWYSIEGVEIVEDDHIVLAESV